MWFLSFSGNYFSLCLASCHCVLFCGLSLSLATFSLFLLPLFFTSVIHLQYAEYSAVSCGALSLCLPSPRKKLSTFLVYKVFVCSMTGVCYGSGICFNWNETHQRPLQLLLLVSGQPEESKSSILNQWAIWGEAGLPLLVNGQSKKQAFHS